MTAILRCADETRIMIGVMLKVRNEQSAIRISQLQLESTWTWGPTAPH